MDGLEAVFFPELCSSIGEAGGFNCFADCSEKLAVSVTEVEFHFLVSLFKAGAGWVLGEEKVRNNFVLSKDINAFCGGFAFSI